MDRTAEVDFLLREFEQRESAGETEWLLALRRRAIDEFGRLGFPTQKSEEYRYTNVAPIAKAKLPARGQPGSIDALPPGVLDLDGAATVVLVDGVLSPALSQLDRLPEGVSVKPLADALEEEWARARFARLATPDRNGIYALNAAFARGGIAVEVPPKVEAPLRLVHVSTDSAAGTAGHLRHLLSLGRASELTLVEEFVALTDAPYFTTVVREVEMDEGSSLKAVELIRESPAAFHIGSLVARLPRDARLQQVGLTLKGALVRREAHVELAGEGADATLGGLYVPRGRDVHDQLTFVDHAVPRCTSNQLYKGVLDDDSRGVFNGKVLVRKDAQQTLAYQQNRSIVLSDSATADTRPQLEIYADDVKCSHGATIGQLDDEALFYLRQRGISARDAQRLLMQAFVGEVVELLPVSSLRDQVAAAAANGLPRESA